MKDRVRAHPFLTGIVVVTIAALASAALAGSALASHVHCGDVITTDIRLDSDLTNCVGNGVFIGADGITLDLAGHTIDGTRFGLGDDSGVNNSAGHDGVTIENGTIQEFQFGIESSDGDRLALRRLFLRDHIFHGALIVRSHGSLIEKSGGSGNGGHFINLLQSDGNVVEKNSVDVPPGRDAGIILFQSNNNRVTKNSISGSVRGIELGTAAFNVVEQNTVSGGSTGIFLFDSPSNVLADNRAVGNAGDGIFVAGNSSALIDSNFASRNGDDGIDSQGPSTIRSNIANANRDLGIFAGPGSIDGGGNHAVHNGNPAQCVNVSC